MGLSQLIPMSNFSYAYTIEMGYSAMSANKYHQYGTGGIGLTALPA